MQVEIGQAFGGRDHSTVIHSVEKYRSSTSGIGSFGSAWSRPSMSCSRDSREAECGLWTTGENRPERPRQESSIQSANKGST